MGSALLALLFGGVRATATDDLAQAPAPQAKAAATTPAEGEAVPPKLPRRTEEVVVQAVRADADTP
ncbi:MAG: hypothetical protein IPL90_03805 [Holophagales bacterium]|nr:hypothetical protein [Holophagales bacterium]